MIQPLDFKKKQILFLNASNFNNCDLKLNNENIIILLDIDDSLKKEKIPIHHLLAIFIIGDLTITSKLIQKINKAGVVLFFLKDNFETYVDFGSIAEGNYILRQKQYFLSIEQELEIAKNIVKNKLLNQLSLLRTEKINKIENLNRKKYKEYIFKKIKNAKSFSSLRGIEGVTSKNYFKLYFSSINWYKRIPRGKIDENNILLDIGYTFLFNFVDAILRLYGFDRYKGIYHKLFFQRKSLACDFMEPFRCIIDRSLVKMYRLGQFCSKDFGCKQGKYYLQYKYFGKYSNIFLKEILRYKNEIYKYIREHYYLILNNEGKVNNFIIR